MKKILLFFIVCIFVLTTAVACGDEQSVDDGDTDNVVPVVQTDTTSPLINAEYEYKIVKVGSEVVLPSVSFDEEVSAVYTLDDEAVAGGSTFTPTAAGVKVYKITATDKAGNKSVKEIIFTITANDDDLNKIYALDTAEGLEKHIGTSRNALNNMELTLIRTGAARPVDLNGQEVPDLYLDGNGEVTDSASAAKTVSQYIRLNFTSLNGRMVFDNPLYKKWNERFSQIYFYVYNAGLKTMAFNFNNYGFTVAPSSGWQKIIIAPKAGENGIITDFAAISSLGGSYQSEGLFDLEDCVGATLRITAPIRYERIFMTAVYGKPVQ